MGSIICRIEREILEKLFLSCLLLLIILNCSSQIVNSYKSLDNKQPITFRGTFIVYKEDTIKLGPKAFFIDGQFTDEEVSTYPFVFNSINKASEHLTNGTEESPMVLYIAPHVYWIDNPDDTAIRVPAEGSTPYGLIVKCEWLKFYGLTDNAENVVLASNRGQTIGARGNFTMFKFVGQGTGSENITFGNYCNVDLVYPLKPALNRQKRASAIVQAQLIHCNGDKIVARNTRFISRLNLCPFVGGKRVLFDRCHFESTDDALCGTGVYMNSTLDFYGSKPFYNTTGTGAVFFNCDIRSFTGDNQYFTKANGQVAVLDSRFKSESDTYLGWQDVVPLEARNYQYNNALNGKKVFIGKRDPASTIDMSGKPVLDAYRFNYNGKVIYNSYNLLSGNDGWDPMNIKDTVLAAEKEFKRSFTKLPVQLLVSPTRVSIETGKDSVTLNVRVNRFGNYESNAENIKWSVSPIYKSLVQLKVSNNGASCTVIPTNTNNETKQVVVEARTASGLEAASVITVSPSILSAPNFTVPPGISSAKEGSLAAVYKLNTKFNDESRVTWFRCTNVKGANAIEVAVSRFNKPLVNYALSKSDIGYYIMVTVAPKHIRSKEGEAISFVIKKPIAATDVKGNSNVLSTDFKNVSTKNQPQILPGFWSWNHFESKDNEARYTVNKNADAWYYGEGADGAANMWGLLQGRSASMLYTPTGNKFGDMKLTMTVAPFKTAGQGFSVAHLYMDVLVKFDTKTMTGYAVRFIRTTKHHDAVDCILVKYDNGKVSNISEPITTTSFKTLCTITIEATGNKIKVNASTTAPDQLLADRPQVMSKVTLESTVLTNQNGGFGIIYNGGSPTLIRELKAAWR